jgi:hypothetical protein
MEQFLREQRRSDRRFAAIRGVAPVSAEEAEEAAELDLAEVYDNNINYAV